LTAGRSEIVMANRELNPKWSFGTRSIIDWTCGSRGASARRIAVP
jgi:hypothetical protein